MLSETHIPLFLYDAMQVLQAYRPVLVESALQVYQSVLLTMPRCLLYEFEHNQVQGPIPSLISERDSQWTVGNTFLQAPVAQYDNSQLQFSPRGDFLAVSPPDESDNPTMIWGITRDTFNANLELRGPMVYGREPYEIIFGSTIYDFHLNRVKETFGDLYPPASCMATTS
jgi:hypothetical protein